jgi:hypothetical protein
MSRKPLFPRWGKAGTFWGAISKRFYFPFFYGIK